MIHQMFVSIKAFVEVNGFIHCSVCNISFHFFLFLHRIISVSAAIDQDMYEKISNEGMDGGREGKGGEEVTVSVIPRVLLSGELVRTISTDFVPFLHE